MTTFKKNSINYTTSLALSLIGSEAFKLGSSIFIYKFTGNLWLVTLLYLFIQLPSILVYIFSSKIVQRIKNNKLVLLLSDLTSVILLIPSLVIFFLTENKSILSIVLIVCSSILGFINAFRFVFLKNIVYFITNNNEELKTINIANSFATSFGFLLSAILSFFLFKNIQFYWLVVMNMVSYLISGILYFTLKVNKTATDFQSNDQSNKIITKRSVWKSWIFILSGSLIIGVFLYPRTSGLSQFFSNVNNFKIDSWGFYLSIIFTAFSLLGVITSFIVKKYIKNQTLFIVIVAIIMGILNFVWLLFISSNENGYFISYVIITSIQQFLFSIFISIFYTLSFQLFDSKKFHKQNGLSIVFRIIVSSILTVFFTILTTKLSYIYSFILYSIIIIVSCLGIVLTIYDWRQMRTKRFYNSSEILEDYKKTTNSGLSKFEKDALNTAITKETKVQRILEIGCGTGRVSLALRQLFPEAEIDAIDIAKKLLLEAPSDKNINFQLANILDYEQGSKYDLIIFSANGLSNIISKCDVRKLFKKIRLLLKDVNSHFIFTIHDIFASDEEKDFWINKIKINEQEIFSNKKILDYEKHGIKNKNRFYSPEDMIKILDEFKFKINNSFKTKTKTNENLLLELSGPCIFYDISKLD
ncbi:MFS transporter [Mycoplasma phocoeninasale]|uniref:Methyltransferase domain-containing protein n=1 Tax=Mycoplasma phocoeninasale TaxID=2726117 RepID=A0A858U1P0_9MOLU|nr:MFS transporter [Mycoplasma phocoeninasale]MBN0970507.1 methyltransferase domain-containing protein [Mycoplasma phocoeninasale]QJG66370.1 methyltransferase domain-containing protein [Mycoplasma phocoeninasale]